MLIAIEMFVTEKFLIKQSSIGAEKTIMASIVLTDMEHLSTRKTRDSFLCSFMHVIVWSRRFVVVLHTHKHNGVDDKNWECWIFSTDLTKSFHVGVVSRLVGSTLERCCWNVGKHRIIFSRYTNSVSSVRCLNSNKITIFLDCHSIVLVK